MMGDKGVFARRSGWGGLVTLLVFVDQFCPKWPFKERAGALVALVKVFGIAVKDALGQHPCLHDPILTYKPVIMIGHQAIGDDGNGKLGNVRFDPPEDVGKVIIIQADVAASCAAVVDVIILSLNELRISCRHGTTFVFTWRSLRATH